MSEATPGVLLVLSLVTLALIGYVALRELLWMLRHEITSTRHGQFTAFTLVVVAIGGAIEAYAHWGKQHDLDFIGSALVQGGMFLLALFLIGLHPQLRRIAAEKGEANA